MSENYKLPCVVNRLIETHRQNRTNFGKSFRGRFDRTTDYLRWRIEYQSFSEQLNYIASELEREKLYAFYRRLFPVQWEKSRTSFRRREKNEFHSERELEFIELVSENLFPLNAWLDWTDFRFDHIPIEPVNFDFCCDECDLEELCPCLQFGVTAFLCRGGIEDENYLTVLDNFKVPAQALPPINRETPPFAELDANREHPKIRRFLHLVEFLFHDSGNPFIDTTYCQPVDLYEWSLENVEKLKNHYESVNEYFASMASIDEDIERDALSAFAELIGIWNTGKLRQTQD